MRTRIKFCGLVEPGDVDDAVALGADAIGFVFFPRSPRHVDAAQVRALRARLPSFVSAVGLFVNAEPAQVRSVVQEAGLDVVQFHGDESPEICVASVPPDTPWWRAVRMRGTDDLLSSAARFARAEALLLDAFSDGYGGSGKAFDWDWIRPVPGRRLILSGGLSPETVAEAIDRVAPFAVDVSSGIQVEGQPRRKDRERMARFVAQVVAADARAAARASGAGSGA